MVHRVAGESETVGAMALLKADGGIALDLTTPVDALCDAIKDELWPNPLRYYELGVELGAGAES